MTPAQHKNVHVALHTALNNLLDDFILHKGPRFSDKAIGELLDWSYSQTINPDELGHKDFRK